ncbi:MAG: hypothetical protein FWG88_04250 [Oscillospiraceae bacterium]|nr:hypothetical protein [Oscillospiraceae bacterium]
MRREWEKLDNAAKIYPSTQIKTDTHVFRYCCELYDDIDQDILQAALEDTLELYDIFQVTLKRGVFWYYLEDSDIIPIVREEHSHVCAKLSDNYEKSLLLEVTYFGKRINLEMFHVLTDGTGAMNFLRTLVIKYLSIKMEVDEATLDYDASQNQMLDDSYGKYYSGSKDWKREKAKAACQITGAKYSDNRLRAITGRMSTAKVLEKAHEYGSTLTVYLAACLTYAIGDVLNVREKKKPLILNLPVNLRKYFPSESIRNFFATLFIPYNLTGNGETLDNITAAIKDQLEKNVTEENLAKILDGLSAAENNPIAKIVPLRIKDFFLRRFYIRNLKNYTATCSNVGIFNIPEIYKDHIRSFDVMIGTSKLHMCICSYLDTLSITFTTPFRSSDVERQFFRLLTFAGIEVEIIANEPSNQEVS